MRYEAQTDPRPTPIPSDLGRTSTNAGERIGRRWESEVPPGAPVWTPDHGDFA